MVSKGGQHQKNQTTNMAAVDPVQAPLEAESLPADAYVLPLKQRIPISKLDNLEVVEVPDSNRRRLIGTYTHVGADGATKVHKVSVYIKSAKPAGGVDAELKPKKKISKPKKEKAPKLSELDQIKACSQEILALIEVAEAKKRRRSQKKQVAAEAIPEAAVAPQ